jgi:4-hydroxy-3-methylbut-2-en-1-yl diphosphate synthase IspG/GcpE
MSKTTVADRLGTRRPTREVAVGCWALGGTNPIRVQSMTMEHTEDLERTAAQVRRLEKAMMFETEHFIRTTAAPEPRRSQAKNLRAGSYFTIRLARGR